MEGKIIIECLILLLVVSLAFASIYAAETGEVSQEDTSDWQSHLYISGSGDVSHILDAASPDYQNYGLPTVYV